MRRFSVPITVFALLVATMLALSGPALAADVTIYAYSPSSLRTGPVLQGSTWTFTYLVSDDQSLIGTGVPAVVYIMQSRGQKVVDSFATTLLPGSGVLSLSPQWTCNLKPSSYNWTLWPTFPNPATTFNSISEGFTVVRNR